MVVIFAPLVPQTFAILDDPVASSPVVPSQTVGSVFGRRSRIAEELCHTHCYYTHPACQLYESNVMLRLLFAQSGSGPNEKFGRYLPYGFTKFEPIGSGAPFLAQQTVGSDSGRGGGARNSAQGPRWAEELFGGGPERGGRFGGILQSQLRNLPVDVSFSPADA